MHIHNLPAAHNPNTISQLHTIQTQLLTIAHDCIQLHTIQTLLHNCTQSKHMCTIHSPNTIAHNCIQSKHMPLLCALFDSPTHVIVDRFTFAKVQKCYTPCLAPAAIDWLSAKFALDPYPHLLSISSAVCSLLIAGVQAKLMPHHTPDCLELYIPDFLYRLSKMCCAA